MDRERQTLELLQLLGDDVADVVMEKLPPESAARIRTAMQTGRPVVSTIRRQREVLDEFECFFQFALLNRTTDQRPQDISDPNLSSDVPTTGEEVDDAVSAEEDRLDESELEASENAVTADDRSADTESDEQNPESEETDMTAQAVDSGIPSTGDPIQDLQLLSVYQIAQSLASEQARTSAILLSQLPAKMTGDILSLLTPAYQKLVMMELTREQHAPAVLVERIARATFQRAQQMSPEPPDTRDHADRVAEVLRSVPRAGRKNMLAVIEEQDAELAKLLLTRIYRFDDLATLSKNVMQRVLGEIDSGNLTMALLGAAEPVRNAVFANISKRARQSIEEEMQFMTNVPESRVLQARETIAEVIARIDMDSES